MDDCILGRTTAQVTGDLRVLESLKLVETETFLVLFFMQTRQIFVQMKFKLAGASID